MLIDLRNLLSGAKDDMTVSAPLEMETFQTALAEYPVMEKQPVELVLTRTGKDELHISGNGFVALEIPCDRCLEPVRTEIHFDIDKDIDMQELMNLGDQLKAKLGDGVILLASENGGKVSLLAMATDGAMKKGAHAGNLIKAVAKLVGGGGGGRPNMAQAGGKNPAGINQALEAGAEELAKQLH